MQSQWDPKGPERMEAAQSHLLLHRLEQMSSPLAEVPMSLQKVLTGVWRLTAQKVEVGGSREVPSP